jgi:hypothetical protein
MGMATGTAKTVTALKTAMAMVLLSSWWQLRHPLPLAMDVSVAGACIALLVVLPPVIGHGFMAGNIAR